MRAPTIHEGACKYKRVRVRNRVVYRCMMPGCSKYKLPAFILNAKARCFYCDNEFIITKELARRERLRCDNCVVRRKPRIQAEEANEFLVELSNDE